MSPSDRFLSPREAARQLGVSPKALRLYEQRGLLVPRRSATGWRVYGPHEMARAMEIVALRDVGLSLAQVGLVLGGDLESLEPVLAAHQAALEHRIGQLSEMVGRVGGLRADIAQGKVPAAGELNRVLQPGSAIKVAFDLPWPWGGERFELNDVRALNYIIGPLGSGKTRLARALAETLPGARFLGLERLEQDGAAARAQLDRDPELKARVEGSLEWLIGEGAQPSDALLSLLIGIEAVEEGACVVDMIEQRLEHGTQEALMARLRRRGSRARPLFLLTRSSAILDLEAVGQDEAIIFCPANHSPPTRVAPHAGAPGYEAVATCLATPEVRARTEGVIAWRPGRA